MKKAVLPINYIVALIFGVIAIGLLGYWFFVQSGRTISIGITAECEAKQKTFCQLWNATNWKVKPPEPDWGNCPKINTQPDCKKLLGYS